jgi:hypothetical protein
MGRSDRLGDLAILQRVNLVNTTRFAGNHGWRPIAPLAGKLREQQKAKGVPPAHGSEPVRRKRRFLSGQNLSLRSDGV